MDCIEQWPKSGMPGAFMAEVGYISISVTAKQGMKMQKTPVGDESIPSSRFPLIFSSIKICLRTKHVAFLRSGNTQKHVYVIYTWYIIFKPVAHTCLRHFFSATYTCI